MRIKENEARIAIELQEKLQKIRQERDEQIRQLSKKPKGFLGKFFG